MFPGWHLHVGARLDLYMIPAHLHDSSTPIHCLLISPRSHEHRPPRQDWRRPLFPHRLIKRIQHTPYIQDVLQLTPNTFHIHILHTRLANRLPHPWLGVSYSGGVLEVFPLCPRVGGRGLRRRPYVLTFSSSHTSRLGYWEGYGATNTA